MDNFVVSDDDVPQSTRLYALKTAFLTGEILKLSRLFSFKLC